MDPMLEAFIAESRENLETAGRCFLELEQQPGDEELLNDLFRSMHTIKGSSGLFDIPALTGVVHAAEDVLDTVRSGELDMTPEHVDLFLDAMDQVNAWLDDLETTGTLGEGADERSVALVRDLRGLLQENGADDSVAVDAAQPQPPHQTDDTAPAEGGCAAPPGWLTAMPEEERLSLHARAATDGEAVVAIEYTPDPQCFFSGEDPLHLVRLLPGLIWFRVEAREPWPQPVEMDPYQCNLIFHAVAQGAESDMRQHLRYVAEQVRLTPLAPDQLAIPVGEPGDSEPFEPFIEEAGRLLAEDDLEGMRQRIPPLLEIGGAGLLQTSALRWMEALLRQEEPNRALLKAMLDALSNSEFRWPDMEFNPGISPDTPRDPESGGATPSGEVDESRLAAVRQALTVQRQILSMTCPADLLAGRIASVARVVRNLAHAAGVSAEGLDAVTEAALGEASTTALAEFVDTLLSAMAAAGDDMAPATEARPETRHPVVRQDAGENKESDDRVQPRARMTGERTPAATAGEASARSKTLRVDQQRIDALMDLVGELVVAKNAIPFLARRAENDFGIRHLAKEIKAQYAVINRIVEELQGAVMQIRMVPVSSVFQRFPRLVRDLSRKLDKQIRLVLEGEETEADKNVVEDLADPLIHLVRNSLDHGLESAQEREAAGKPAEGTLVLRAIPHDDQVVIEVVDDGRGIDPEAIKRKAYEKGIIDEHRLDTITDQEALQLIFAPGFSTADTVSDLSGRGVGMDVVRSVVVQAGGTVNVESKKGQGTTIRLTLPLSMAITRIMMIEVAGQCYGIAMENIMETVRIPAADIQRIKHSEAVVLRGQLIPLFRLRRLLGLGTSSEPAEEIAILVMKVAGQEIGLVVDAFHEGLDIIQKSLEGVMAHYPWFTGAALLGDGRVLLVLNIRELLSCR